MIDQRAYAAKREAGRSQAAIIYGCFVAAIGVATALTTRGPLRTGLLVLVVLVIGYCLAFLLRPLRPRELTVLRVRQHPESFTATTPLMTFPARSSVTITRPAAPLRCSASSPSDRTA